MLHLKHVKLALGLILHHIFKMLHKILILVIKATKIYYDRRSPQTSVSFHQTQNFNSACTNKIAAGPEKVSTGSELIFHFFLMWKMTI